MLICSINLLTELLKLWRNTRDLRNTAGLAVKSDRLIGNVPDLRKRQSCVWLSRNQIEYGKSLSIFIQITPDN